MDASRLARLFGALVVATASSAHAQMPTVVGSWTRVSLRDPQGKAIQPPYAPAFLLFSANGYFSQTSMPIGRPKLNKELSAMTKEELVARFQYVVAWRGTYAVVGARLTRKTVADIDPTGEGRELVQEMRFASDTLILVSLADKSEARFVRVR